VDRGLVANKLRSKRRASGWGLEEGPGVWLDLTYDSSNVMVDTPRTPAEAAAMTDAEYEAYVRELVREGERSANGRVYSADEVLAHLGEARRGRTRRVGA
jgi:hypothetical protein